MARSPIAQSAFLGVQTVSGTAVPTTYAARAFQVGLEPQVEVKQIRASGSKLATKQVLTKEWSKVTISDGSPCYNHLTHGLAAVIGNETATTVGDKVRHEFHLNSGAGDQVISQTIEQGDDYALRASSFHQTKLSLKFNRNSGASDYSGEGFAGRIAYGVTKNTGVTGFAILPIVPAEISVYVDSTLEDIGTTQVRDFLSIELAVADRFSPTFYLDRDADSFSDVVEGEPKVTAKIAVPAGPSGYSWMNRLRSGETAYVRVECFDGLGNELVVDLAVEVSSPDGIGETDDIWAYSYTLEAIEDADGYSGLWSLTNDLAPVTPGVVAA